MQILCQVGRKCIFLVFIISLPFGCASNDDVFVRDPPYSWGLKNCSSRVFRYDTASTYVIKGRVFRAAFGALSPGVSESYQPGYAPIPDTIHVHWVEEATKSAHDADVPIHGRIPDEDRFTGTLWLDITDDGVTLRPEVNKWYGLKVDLQRFTR